MKAFFKRFPAVLAGLFLILFIFGEVLSACCLDVQFFKDEYKKMGTARTMGMSEDDLMAATDVLLDYLKDERDDISIEVNVHGKNVQMFDERETAHMIDVKALYINAISLTRILGAVGALIFIAMMIKKSTRKTALAGYLDGNLLFLAIIACLGLYAALDFASFWTSFHHVFFTNDLWQLYPDERLIQMVPQQFFSDLVFRIVIIFVIAAGVPAAVAAFFKAKMNKKEKSLNVEQA